MSSISTNRIKDYVQQIYRLLPRSNSWGRLFQAPEDLFVKVADHYPDIESPYDSNPPSAPKNPYTTVMGKLLSLFAIQIMRMDEVVYRLPEESTPTTSVDTLDEWESIYNIEDRTGTIEERQDRLEAVFNNRSIPRSTQYIYDYALTKGITLTIEDIIDPLGGDTFPWSGQWGAGEMGASTTGSYGWGGIIRITILSASGLTEAQVHDIIEPEIHHGTMIDWVKFYTPAIIMTTTTPFTIEQTTTATTTVTQGV